MANIEPVEILVNGRTNGLHPESKTAEYLQRLRQFMDSDVYPAEPVYAAQRAQLAADGRLHEVPAVIVELKVEARRRGLWNLFLPDSEDPPHHLRPRLRPARRAHRPFPTYRPRGHKLRRA